MRELLNNFYLNYAVFAYPGYGRKYFKEVMKKLDKEFPTDEDIWDSFPSRVTKYLKNGDIETLMLFQFPEDSLCIVRHSPEGPIHLCVMDNGGDDWKATIDKHPFWTDFTIKLDHFKEKFDYYAKQTLQKSIIAQT